MQSGSWQLGRMAKFAIVGFIGFGVDSLVLYLLIALSFTPLQARAVSIPVAMLTTWVLNRNWSFERSTDVWYRELATYMAVAGIAAAVNYAVFAAALALMPGIAPFLALVLACAIAMFVSYFGYGRLVFRR